MSGSNAVVLRYVTLSGDILLTGLQILWRAHPGLWPMPGPGCPLYPSAALRGCRSHPSRVAALIPGFCAAPAELNEQPTPLFYNHSVPPEVTLATRKGTR